jgi:hypothetical protein
MSEAVLLAGDAGDIAVPFLKFSRTLSAREAAACVRALGLIGSPEACHMIAEYSEDSRLTVVKEVVRAYYRFAPNLYLPMLEQRLKSGRLDARLVGLVLANSDPKGLVDMHLIRAASFKDMPLVELPLAVRTLHNLLHLTLWNTRISDISSLAGLVNLRYLDLEETRVADLSPLEKLINLQRVFLRNTPVRDITALKGLTDLETLFLSRTQVTDISPLQGLRKLRSLWLPVGRIANEMVEALKEANPRLEVTFS